MSLHYPLQRTYALFGTKNVNSLAISAAALTGSYVGKNITCDYAAQMTLYIQYTPGAGGNGNSLQIKIEFSPDSTNLYQENAELPSVGTTTQYVQERTFDNNGSSVALTTYALRIPVQMNDRCAKISVKETVVGGSAGIIYAEALVGGK